MNNENENLKENNTSSEKISSGEIGSASDIFFFSVAVAIGFIVVIWIIGLILFTLFYAPKNRERYGINIHEPSIVISTDKNTLKNKI